MLVVLMYVFPKVGHDGFSQCDEVFVSAVLEGVLLRIRGVAQNALASFFLFLGR